MPTVYGPIDLVQNEIRNPVAQVLGSAPSTPAKGQFFFNDTTKTLQWYDGTIWNDAKSGAPAFGAVTAQTAYGASSNNGAASTASRSDHVHGTVGLTSNTPSTATMGDAANVGTGNLPARDDHRHGLPAFGASTAETSYGTAKADGVASTVAHSDHGHGNPTHTGSDHATIPVSQMAPATADLSWGSHKITNLLDPTSAQDAATKAYVDNGIAGLSWKDSARAATTPAGGNIVLSGTQTIDGVALSAGDRVLVKNQTTPAQNGLYAVNASAWSRTTDADANAEVEGMAVFINEGTVNADTSWVLTTNAPIAIGGTSLTYAQFSGGGTINAGAGLTLTGNTIDVVAGDTSLTVAADSVVVNTAVIATVASVNTAVTGMAKKFAAALTGTVAYATGEVVTHNLNTRDIQVFVVNGASPYQRVEVDWEATTVNTATLRYNPNLGAGFRVVVVG